MPAARSRAWTLAHPAKMSKLAAMKAVIALILLGLLTGCASKPNESMQDPTEIKADIKAREDFAKSLPKPRDS